MDKHAMPERGDRVEFDGTLSKEELSLLETDFRQLATPLEEFFGLS
jgi:hypothetical protein